MSFEKKGVGSILIVCFQILMNLKVFQEFIKMSARNTVDIPKSTKIQPQIVGV